MSQRQMSNLTLSIDVLFDALPNQILILTDKSGTVLSCNDQATQIAGRDKADIIGKNFDATFQPLGEKDEFHLDGILQASTQFQNHTLKTSSGDILDISLKVSPIKLNGTDEDNILIAGQILGESKSLEQKLYQVMSGTSKEAGQNFLDSVTKALSETLDVSYAFICELYENDTEEWIKSNSFWKQGAHAKPLGLRSERFPM